MNNKATPINITNYVEFVTTKSGKRPLHSSVSLTRFTFDLFRLSLFDYYRIDIYSEGRDGDKAYRVKRKASAMKRQEWEEEMDWEIIQSGRFQQLSLHMWYNGCCCCRFICLFAGLLESTTDVRYKGDRTHT